MSKNKLTTAQSDKHIQHCHFFDIIMLLEHSLHHCQELQHYEYNVDPGVNCFLNRPTQPYTTGDQAGLGLGGGGATWSQLCKNVKD